jgi:MoxR-like ATPase
LEIARRTTSIVDDEISAVLSAEEIVELQRVVRAVPISDHAIRYALSLVRQTRVGEPGAPEVVSEQLAWGAGPRAVQFLILGAKSRALLHGRTHVSTDDLQALAAPVLRHRLVINFAAESEGVTPDDIVAQLIEMTPTKEDELTSDPRFQTIFAS